MLDRKYINGSEFHVTELVGGGFNIILFLLQKKSNISLNLHYRDHPRPLVAICIISLY